MDGRQTAGKIRRRSNCGVLYTEAGVERGIDREGEVRKEE